jgi:hypothetical protein
MAWEQTGTEEDDPARFVTPANSLLKQDFRREGIRNPGPGLVRSDISIA